MLAISRSALVRVTTQTLNTDTAADGPARDGEFSARTTSNVNYMVRTLSTTETLVVVNLDAVDRIVSTSREQPAATSLNYMCFKGSC
jgi:hypothetical protein